MKTFRIFALFALLILAGTACTRQQTEATKASEANATPAGTEAQAPAAKNTGKVIETMDAGEYTYVHVDNGTEKVWAAAPHFEAKVGDEIYMPTKAMPMQNYHSSTLNRTFEVVYFEESIRKTTDPAPAAAANANEMPVASHASEAPQGVTGEMPEGHPEIGQGKTVAEKPADMSLTGIKKADNGQTVADIYAGKEKLAGKPIALRGKVVKFTPDVMGKNWLHVQDGSGQDGSNDLTVTTSAVAKVGDVVLIKGNLSVDKDFGFGYKYALLIEDAQITVE